MYQTILLPLDGSAPSEKAIPYVETLARVSGARVVLLRTPDDSLLEPRVEAERYLSTVREALAGSGLTVETVVVDGKPSEVIVQEAHDRHADVVAMTTHGRSGIGRWIYGSVTEGVLHSANTPVLLIPAAGEYTWPLRREAVSPGAAPAPATNPEQQRPFRILVTLDGSDVSQAVLSPASEFARHLDAELHLMRVVVPPVYPYGEVFSYMSFDPSPELEAARQYLEEMASILRGYEHPIQVHTEFGFAASSIATLAREQQIDVIAMATHGRTGLARLVMGSVATAVMHLTSLPLLLVRPAALRRIEEGAEPAATAAPGASS
jgi:nucleotide-binding universal stress UspA family protein